MTKKEYQKALDSHDWLYRYSDSENRYKTGLANEKSLLELAKKDEEFQRLYSLKEKQMLDNG